MRYLDIAVAVLVGTSAVSGTLAWSPRPADAESHRLAVQVQMRDSLFGFIEQHGMEWLLHTQVSELCAEISVASNPTFVMFASIGGSSCGVVPPKGAVESTVSFRLVAFEVALGAWTTA